MRIVKNTPVEESGRFTFEAPLIELVKELKRLNELLETHTVKEPDLELVESLAIASKMSVKKQNSEKEEHKHRMEDTPLNSEYCLDCGVVFGKKEEVKKQPTTPDSKLYGVDVCCTHDGLNPDKVAGCDCVCHKPTTPETKVKISCPDCPHEETDTPEKKPSERIKELEKRLKKDQPNPMDDLVKYSIYCANMKVRAVINYLDELHSKGKL